MTHRGLLSDDYLIWNSNRNNTDFKIEHDTGYVQIGKNNGSRDADSPLSVISDNSSSGYALKVGAGGGGSEDRGIYARLRNVPTSAGVVYISGFTMVMEVPQEVSVVVQLHLLQNFLLDLIFV